MLATTSFGVVSYALAGMVYGAALVLFLVNHPGGRRAWLLIAAIGGTLVWAVALAVLLATNGRSQGLTASLDAVHLLVWIACVLSWLDGARFGRRSALLASMATIWVIVASMPLPERMGLARTGAPAVLMMTVLGLLAAEQVLRNAPGEQRRHLRLLCVATGGIFVTDLFVYAEAAVLGAFSPRAWEVRGLVNAGLLPLIVIAVKRQREWEHGLFVSRQVTLYTASLLAVGAYLLAMGFAAYALRYFDHAWDLPITMAFSALAAGLLVFIFFSATLRRRFRAFLIKHFYRNKYDYRLEWLRLTQSLGLSSDLKVLAANGLEAMVRIAGSSRGQLWLSRDSVHYECVASFGTKLSSLPAYPADHALVQFLRERFWVIDSAEYVADPDRYGNAFGPPEECALPKESLVVPLALQSELQGFVVLENPAGAGSLTFEDHDILKTAGKQLAVALSQALTMEQLAETRQFEVINKMAAFLMHDLKNILSQQQLVIANAARYRDRPGFIDDAIVTIKAGAERMRHVLEQLDRSRSSPLSVGRSDLSKVLMEVRSHCADREPVPSIDAAELPALWVPMDRDKLVSVLTHLIRNAQDATPRSGFIRLRARKSGADIVCTIEDSGCGMDAQFIRERLFRPFDSTKGAAGMGVGAYQARELVRAAGGEVEVSSVPSVGTTFSVRFVAADSDASPHRRRVAAVTLE